MPTLTSIMRNDELIANVSHKYFKTDSAAADKSVVAGALAKTNGDFIKSVFGGQPALTTLVENYSADKEDFQSKFQDRLVSLQESADKLKDSVQEDTENSTLRTEKNSDNDKKSGSTLSTLGNFAKNNVPPRAKILAFQPKQKPKENEVDKRIAEQAEKIREENLNSAKTSPKDSFKEFAENYLVADDKDSDKKSMQPQPPENKKIAHIQNFVRNYNSAVSYLNENRGMSNKISALASNFGKDENLNQSLNKIGISVNSAGELSVDEKELSSALEKDSDSVNSVLGNEGLAGQLDKNLNLANYQSDNLFPTIEEYANEDEFENWEYLYAAQTTKTANYAQHKAGNILNMFT